MKIFSFLFLHPSSSELYGSTLRHFQKKNMVYHIHLIQATIIFHSDYYNGLLTSPSFYPPLPCCISTQQPRVTFNFIQVIPSSAQDPPLTSVYFTWSESQSPYQGAAHKSTVCCSSHSLSCSHLWRCLLLAPFLAHSFPAFSFPCYS